MIIRSKIVTPRYLVETYPHKIKIYWDNDPLKLEVYDDMAKNVVSDCVWKYDNDSFLYLKINCFTPLDMG